MVPIAPFTFIKLAAGASHIRFADFILGTLVGMAPGIVVIVLLGNQLAQVPVGRGNDPQACFDRGAPADRHELA